MAFCQKCGTQFDDGSAFCPSCGAAAQAQQQQQQYQQPQQPQYGYAVKPKIPGRGFGIAGLVLGIIGLVFAVIDIAELVALMDTIFVIAFEEAIPTLLIRAVLPILAVCFGSAARSKGYRNGVGTSGLVLGVIGVALYAISLIICLTA